MLLGKAPGDASRYGTVSGSDWVFVLSPMHAGVIAYGDRDFAPQLLEDTPATQGTP